MKITHQNIAIIHTRLRIDAAYQYHTNRIMGQGDEEVGDVSAGIMQYLPVVGLE